MKFSIEEHVLPFSGVFHIETEEGYIVWRRGTGGNVELLHIRAYKPRDGAGTRLFQAMLEALKVDRPYSTVFGFTRASNKSAIEFYVQMGFMTSPVKGVYADGVAIVFSQTYDNLLEWQQLRAKHANSRPTS